MGSPFLKLMYHDVLLSHCLFFCDIHFVWLHNKYKVRLCLMRIWVTQLEIVRYKILIKSPYMGNI